jgi:hypothetical protein
MTEDVAYLSNRATPGFRMRMMPTAAPSVALNVTLAGAAFSVAVQGTVFASSHAGILVAINLAANAPEDYSQAGIRFRTGLECFITSQSGIQTTALIASALSPAGDQVLHSYACTYGGGGTGREFASYLDGNRQTLVSQTQTLPSKLLHLA